MLQCFKKHIEKNCIAPQRAILYDKIITTYFFDMLDNQLQESNVFEELDKMTIPQVEYFLENGSL